jgi:hypothetical protein
MSRSMNRLSCVLVLSLVACGDKGGTDANKESSAHASSKNSAKASASQKPAASAPASAAAVEPSASGSASPSAAPPVTLSTMFDGAPDASVKLASNATFGKATIGLPDGWSRETGWDSVDYVARKDKAAGVVLLRLDISDGLLDSNLATWVKVPFATSEVKWEPREPGKIGRAHLDAKVAKGSGKIGKDDADFWHVATATDGKKYGLVLIAGLKKSADAQARAELTAALRSVEWK